MINICCDIFIELDLPINVEKSHCIRIGPRFKMPCSNLTVYSHPLCWKKSTVFLGVTIVCGKHFACEWQDARSKFYKASNTFLSKLGSCPQIDVALKLFQSKCVPVLMYGLAAVSLTKTEVNKFTFAYNSVFSKLFKTNCNNTIKLCQYYCNNYSFEHIYDYYRYNFLRKLYVNDRLNAESAKDFDDYQDMLLLKMKYNFNDSDSVNKIRWKIWQVFQQSFCA